MRLLECFVICGQRSPRPTCLPGPVSCRGCFPYSPGAKSAQGERAPPRHVTPAEPDFPRGGGLQVAAVVSSCLLGIQSPQFLEMKRPVSDSSGLSVLLRVVPPTLALPCLSHGRNHGSAHTPRFALAVPCFCGALPWCAHVDVSAASPPSGLSTALTFLVKRALILPLRIKPLSPGPARVPLCPSSPIDFPPRCLSHLFCPVLFSSSFFL